MAGILAHDWFIIALPLRAPAFCMPHATLFLQPEASVGSPSKQNPESYPHPSQNILVSYKDHTVKAAIEGLDCAVTQVVAEEDMSPLAFVALSAVI